MTYRAAGKLDLALPLLVETVEKTKAKLGADHLNTLLSMGNLADCYRVDGKLDLAMPLFVETVHKMNAKLGADHSYTLQCTNNLALTYKAAGKLDLALPLYLDTLEKLKVKFGPDHPDTLQTMSNLAVAFVQAERYADAEPLLIHWIAKKRLQLPADDLGLAFRLHLLGACRVELKKHAEAEQPLRDSLAIYLKRQPMTVQRYNTESLLGAALAGQKKFADAEPLLMGSAKVLLASAAKISPGERKLALAAVERLIDFYGAQGNVDEAAKWRKLRDEAFPPPKSPCAIQLWRHVSNVSALWTRWKRVPTTAAASRTLM
jgi:tetratricopeptide (TPR) repeat protein